MFDKFPQMLYTFDGRNAVLLTDFMRRVAVPKAVRENLSLYELYDIVDGDTPEIVADKVYQSPTLHWIILTLNEIVDPRFDWCLSQENLEAVCQHKYGDNLYATHHFEDSTGLVVDEDFAGSILYPVSNYEFEERRNEEKRRIRILSPQFVSEFVKQFETEISK